MPATRPAASRFRYLAGDPSLDLVNTVDWTDAGLRDERLPDYPSLLSWARGAGLLSAARERSLRRLAGARPAEARRVLQDAVRLRQLVREVSVSVARGEVDGGLLARFNHLVRQTQARRRLRGADRRSVGLAWSWEEEVSLAAPLWPVTLAAATLLSSPEAGRIRVCEGSSCGWMYVDRSRNGLRRWCAMDMCGGKEKARRHYARVKASRETGG
jgi:predicted RNA-binding Zn ribbon-like protein